MAGNGNVTSCSCGTSVCSASATVVANGQDATEIERTTPTMSGDTSSTDVVTSGFGGPWGFGGQASLKPAEVALISTNNQVNSTFAVQAHIATESLRHEMARIGASVEAVKATQQAQESARLQRELDEIRSSQSTSLLQQILLAVTKTTPTA